MKSESSEESDDEVAEIDITKVKKDDRKKSVSAEVFGAHNKREDFKARLIPKTQDVK